MKYWTDEKVFCCDRHEGESQIKPGYPATMGHCLFSDGSGSVRGEYEMEIEPGSEKREPYTNPNTFNTTTQICCTVWCRQRKTGETAWKESSHRVPLASFGLLKIPSSVGWANAAFDKAMQGI